MKNNKNRFLTVFFLPKIRSYLILNFCLTCIIFFLNWKYGIIGFMMFGILIYYNYKTGHSRRREIVNYIENLTFNIDTATKHTLLNFPMPIVVVDMDGKIMWNNTFFRDLFDEQILLENDINLIFKDFNIIFYTNDRQNKVKRR